MKKILTTFFIFINFIFFAKDKFEDLNNVKYFSENFKSDNFYYFSFLNPKYYSDEDKKYIYNCSKEIAKFINIKIKAVTDENTFGSFIITDQNISVTYDAEITNEFIDKIKISQIIPTEYGDILTLRISKENLNKVWTKYNSQKLPSINLNLEQNITDDYPSWFLEVPKIKGYLIAAASYDYSNNIYSNFKNSDYLAMIEMIKIEINSEIRDYFDSKYDITSFFSHETSSANLVGIFIVKRYYDKKTSRAFSLAIMKLD